MLRSGALVLPGIFETFFGKKEGEAGSGLVENKSLAGPFENHSERQQLD